MNLSERKKRPSKPLNRRPEFAKLNIGDRRKNTAYADAASKIAGEFARKLDDLRYHVAKVFEEQRRKDLPDYHIFMAIAEDIGYDSTGRATKTNELEQIATELSRFIESIEKWECMSFILSKSATLPTTFLVQRSQLRGRLDAEYNSALLTISISSKYPQPTIREIASSKAGGTPSKSRPEYWEGTIPWASPKDFGSFHLTQTTDHISKEAVLDSATTLVAPGTLLIVFRSGILQHSLPVEQLPLRKLL